MKIWFDLSNSPHVIMFYDLIKSLESEGHEIIITSRPLANTIPLLEQYGLSHTPVGSHYGKKLLNKLFGYPVRVMQLFYHLKKHKPDLAVSQSSFHSPVVARLLGIPSIYTNDNEHAIGNYPAFFFATKVLLPESMQLPGLFNVRWFRHKFIRYPGIKEGIYLWRRGMKIKVEREKMSTYPQKIFIRPEPNTAQYYNGKHNFLDKLIFALQDEYVITILARDKSQQLYYSSHESLRTQVPVLPLSFDEIAIQCTVFIGAGGSMTRELAAIGIPSVSVYQSELLNVDKWLISKGLLVHDPDLTPVKLKRYSKQLQENSGDNVVMKDGEMAYALFKKTIDLFDYKQHVFKFTRA
jgi:uncharacterized protein